MGNGKKVCLVLILALTVALAPIASAGPAESASLFGVFGWLEHWLGEMIGPLWPTPTAPGDSSLDDPEHGSLLVPSG